MSVTIYLYHPERGLEVHESEEILRCWPQDATLWVDVETQDPEVLSKVASYLGLHELSVEDCLTPGHFPKIDDYGNYFFLIFRAIKSHYEVERVLSNEKALSEPSQPEALDDDQEDKFTRKIALYLSDKFILTYRRLSVPWLDAIVRQVKQHPEASIGRGTDVLAHRVVDVLTDRFMRGLNFFESNIEQMETVAIREPDQFDIGKVLELKGELVWLRHMLRDQRVVISKLAADQTVPIKKQQRRYFKDIEDHAVEALTTMDKLIDDVLGLRDAHISYSNMRLGDTMRVLTVITTLAAPLNILIGLYGMNFEAMPFLHNPHGFWFLVCSMVLIALLMLLYFRKKHWI